MPTYEYLCENCRYKFESFQSMSSEPIKICPKCGLSTVTRLISGGTGLIFKGSGFYITDYSKKNNSTSTAQPKPSVTDSVKKPKTESKPGKSKSIKADHK